MSEVIQMTSNFEGLIELLARSLYTHPDVFVRELVQNAHDGIVRRLAVEPDLAGKIEISISPDEGQLSIQDNGLGMSEVDIRNFLSVIGSTGTGTARASSQDTEHELAVANRLIGQFGIGLLSAFVVAERVIVRTQRHGTQDAFEWSNRGSTECEFSSIPRRVIGTEVELTIRSEHSYLLAERRLRSSIIKFCDLVPFPIALNSAGPVNRIHAPWDRTAYSCDEEKESAYRDFIRHRCGDEGEVPLDVIPINLSEPCQVQGVLWISDRHVPDVNTTGVVDLFIRRMFIREADPTLLPRWAKFVRGVLNTADLEPNAARDDVRRDSAFEMLRSKLGEVIVARLMEISSSDPLTFKRINAWHHYHLKGMAYYHREFFDQIAHVLLFETNRGPLALQDYIAKNSPRADKEMRVPIYYFRHGDSAAQCYRLAEARDWVVINAGRVFEEELLKRYSEQNEHAVFLQAIDESDDPALFHRVPDNDPVEGVARILDAVLRRGFGGGQEIRVQVRKFDPPELPAVLLFPKSSADSGALRYFSEHPWLAKGLEEITREALKSAKQSAIFLNLNAQSPLLKQISELDQNDVPHDILIGIYHSAVLYAQNYLTKANADALHSQLIDLLQSLVDKDDKLRSFEKEVKLSRLSRVTSYSGPRAGSTVKADHVRLFMITPFDEAYSNVETAVREIFETAPYFFEILLARDRTLNPSLLGNIRAHFDSCMGFVAEISDLNPNVMFELGAAMMPDNGRPIFVLRRAEVVERVPADLRDRLYIEYRESSAPSIDIADDIRQALERDGKLAHSDLAKLVASREKRFLSRKTLENFSRTRLEDADILRILGEFTTIEDFLATDESDLIARLELEEFVVRSITAELRKLVI